MKEGVKEGRREGFQKAADLGLRDVPILRGLMSTARAGGLGVRKERRKGDMEGRKGDTEGRGVRKEGRGVRKEGRGRKEGRDKGL